MGKQLSLELARGQVALQTRRQSLGGGGSKDLTVSSQHDKCNFPAGGVLGKNGGEDHDLASCLASVPARQWKRRDHRSMVFVMCGCVDCIKALSVVDLARAKRSKKHGTSKS